MFVKLFCVHCASQTGITVHFENHPAYKLLLFAVIFLRFLWFLTIFAQIEQAKSCAHFSNEIVKSNLQEEKKKFHVKKENKSFIAEAQTSSAAFVSSYYPSVRSSATSLEEEVILSLLGLPSDMHKSSSGMNL